MLIYSIILIVMMIVNWSPKVIAWRKKTFGRAGILGLLLNRKKEVA